jgi:hypothetical protein
MGIQIGEGGFGLILAVIVGILIWKKHGKKSPAWLALFAGLFSAVAVVGWLGNMAIASFYGVGIMTAVLILGAVMFWIEVVKGKTPHIWRTPVFAFALGIALAATFGGIQHAVNNTTVHLTSVISKHTGSNG